jgi:hypothetical protein
MVCVLAHPPEAEQGGLTFWAQRSVAQRSGAQCIGLCILHASAQSRPAHTCEAMV